MASREPNGRPVRKLYISDSPLDPPLLVRAERVAGLGTEALAAYSRCIQTLIPILSGQHSGRIRTVFDPLG
jgi:hypothetical protein